MSTGPRGTRRGRPRWTDAAVWAAVEAGTRQLAEQTGETLRTRVLAHRLATVYGRLDLPQRAGHLFELMHASAFNREAIANGFGVRAHVTGCTVYDAHTAREPWQAGDLMLVDNIRTAHSREAFEGPREVLVSMADPMRTSA